MSKQRKPTEAEIEAVGNEVRGAIVAHARAFALLQGAADRAMDDSSHDSEADDLLKLTDDTHDALIIAIAKRVRGGEADRARMDWLESQHAVSINNLQGGGQSYIEADPAEVRQMAGSLREAIDEARAAEARDA